MTIVVLFYYLINDIQISFSNFKRSWLHIKNFQTILNSLLHNLFHRQMIYYSQMQVIILSNTFYLNDKSVPLILFQKLSISIFKPILLMQMYTDLLYWQMICYSQVQILFWLSLEHTFYLNWLSKSVPR